MGDDKGGSKSVTTNTTNTYDPESSRRLAAIAERQQELSEDQYAFFKESFEPYIREAMDFSRAQLPSQSQYNQDVLDAQRRLLGLREQLESKVLTESARDVEVERTLRDAQREEQMREIQRSSIASDKFYDTAVKGVDLQARLDAISTDVTQAASQAQGMIGRQAARAGIGPRVSDFSTAGTELTRQLAGAMTGARRGAEMENFAMLQAAMQARGQGVTGVSPVGGAGQSVPFQGTSATAGERTAIQSPAQTALGFGQAATAGYGALASRVMGSQGTAPAAGGGDVWGSLAGGAMSGLTMLGGYYLGK